MQFGKPVVPNDYMRKLLKLCVEWYAVLGNECGGCLHIVLDDDNVDDDDLLWCANRTDDKKAIAIIEGLQQLSLMQRKWVTYNIYNVKDGEGVREILEEIEDGASCAGRHKNTCRMRGIPGRMHRVPQTWI